MRERSEILGRYFLHLDTPADPDLYDIIEEVDELVCVNPNEAWEIIKDLVQIAPSDNALAYLAAGPLENLLAARGKGMAGAICDEALRNERIRDALRLVLLEELDPSVRITQGEWLPSPASSWNQTKIDRSRTGKNTRASGGQSFGYLSSQLEWNRASQPLVIRFRLA